MKTIRNPLIFGTALFLVLLGDAPPNSRFGFQLISDAHAILGVWRRHARRWAVVGTAAAATATVAAADETADADAQAAAAEPPAPAAQPQTAAPPPAASGKPLPLGTVVSSLPGGCTSTPVGGVEYYYCDGNFYRASFQGNNLVYVTAKP